jgi:hypothetical protein
MLSPLPRRNSQGHSSLTSPQKWQPSPKNGSGRLPHYAFRGLLSVHSCYGLYTRQVPFRTLYTGGFSRFVTSATAPIATGWSESCRAGFAPAKRPRLFTAHHSLSLRPGDSLTFPKKALSMSFKDSVSLLPAIQATKLLTLISTGLTPVEHTSLRWTHTFRKQ